MYWATGEYDFITADLKENGVLRITLDDQKRRNALSEKMLLALIKIFSAANNDTSIRVIVLSSNGPAFSAGHDLKELTSARSNADQGQEFFSHIMNMCSTLMQNITNCSKPVIAEVEGVATAAGCQLVASCDLAIADNNAKFSTPGVNIGLFCSTPMVALSRNVSKKHAMRMLLTGDMISADHAVDIGLVNQSVKNIMLEDTVTKLAEKIASKSSITLATGKEAFYTQCDMSLPDAYEYASKIMVENMLALDAKEGIGAFIEKRAPIWKDK
ncbi:enoyl-CoA hydratase [Amylibacter sp.]|nr:enoyl-CoA hydratase [Amylibacter sp.]